MSQRLTTAEFIARVKNVHGDLYDYSKVNYKGKQKKVIITCRKHGDFLQTPTHHFFQKSGCPECFGNKKYSTERFIIEAQKVHGNKYDYSKVKWQSARKKVVVVCRIHGEFLQNQNHHIDRKQGCPYCKTSRGENLVISVLGKVGIDYIRQKRFFDCINPISGARLPFDFYIPVQNMLIEYNGDQHYRCNAYWHQNGETLETQQYRDAIKKEYATDHGFKFLAIKYDDKNIEQILQKAVA